MSDQADILREMLADMLHSIPRYEWAVRVAQAKLAAKQAELALARLRADPPRLT